MRHHRRRNPSRQARLAWVDTNTGLAFAGGLILGAKNLPAWVTLLILGTAEMCLQIVCRKFPDLLPDHVPNSAEKALIDTGAGMAGWWVTKS